MERILCIVIGYVFGLFQTGYIYGRLNHIDIRQYGSGNAGTTNALRVLGKKAGIITYLGDALKAVAAGFVVRLLFGQSHPELLQVFVIYSGLGVVLGHNFPFYLGFKGGKGIAATSGMILAFNWKLALIVCVIFILVTAVTRYVSLASLVMMSAFLVLLVAGGIMGKFGMPPYIYEIYAMGAIMTGLAFWKHKANIGRLIKGTENKLGAKKEA